MSPSKVIPQAMHSGPWLSFAQAKEEELLLANGTSKRVDSMTHDQFLEAIALLVSHACHAMTRTRAEIIESKVELILYDMGDEVDMLAKWSVLEELEHIGVPIPSTLQRKWKRKHKAIKP